jgi:predicted RNA binding protein YcfA (HicA-like mRNA interferase family)
MSRMPRVTGKKVVSSLKSILEQAGLTIDELTGLL